MGSLELIVGLGIAASCVTTFYHMRKTRRWLNSHGVDYSFYEEKIKAEKGRSSMNLIGYYTGFPGRKLACYFSQIKENKKA